MSERRQDHPGTQVRDNPQKQAGGSRNGDGTILNFILLARPALSCCHVRLSLYFDGVDLPYSDVGQKSDDNSLMFGKASPRPPGSNCFSAPMLHLAWMEKANTHVLAKRHWCLSQAIVCLTAKAFNRLRTRVLELSGRLA